MNLIFMKWYEFHMNDYGKFIWVDEGMMRYELKWLNLKYDVIKATGEQDKLR